MAIARIGLYYPYAHFRDEAWLKVAALYWPKIARIVPDGYPIHDDSITRILIDRLGFVVNVSPDSGRADASKMMLEALEALEALEVQGDAIQNQYKVRPDSLAGIQKDDINLATDNWADRIASSTDSAVRQYTTNALKPKPLEIRPAPLYASRLIISLRHELVDWGVAVRADPWLGVHPQVAWVYMCVLAEQLAKRNNLLPVTDQVLAHVQTNGWTRDRIVEALLEPSLLPASEQTPETAIGLLAVQLVVPSDLKHLSVKKVIRFRQRYAADFDAFHDAIAAAAAELRDEFPSIADQAVLKTYLDQEVERRFNRPMAELRKAFKGLGIDTTFAAANMKFELPAALATGGGIATHQPMLVGAGAAAFGVLTLGRGVRLKWAERSTPSAASYLWRIERGITPESLLRRLLHC